MKKLNYILIVAAIICMAIAGLWFLGIADAQGINLAGIINPSTETIDTGKPCSEYKATELLIGEKGARVATELLCTKLCEKKNWSYNSFSCSKTITCTCQTN